MYTSGTIKRIDERFVYISYFRRSACSGCHNKKACPESDCKEEEMKIDRKELRFEPEIGMKVNLAIDYPGSPVRLLFLIYGFPVASMLISALILNNLGYDELNILLGVFLSLVISFLIIKVFEKKIVKEKRIGIHVTR